MPDNSVGSSPSHPYGYLQPTDLVHIPRGGTIGPDIALLIHRPGKNAAASVQQSGLKSLQALASEPNAPPEIKQRYSMETAKRYFANDPSVIFFRPVASGTKIGPDHICVAAKKEKINVFHQDERERYYDKHKGYGENMYKASKMSYDEFFRKIKETPKGTIMDRRGNYKPSSFYGGYQNRYEAYSPEVCVDTGRISPSLFVDRFSIPQEFRAD